MKKSTNILCLALISLAFLAACGGGKDSPSGPKPAKTINAHYFVGVTEKNGAELWKSDGTNVGTVLVKDINNGSSSNPSNFTELGDTVYFSANDQIHGVELWKANGVSQSLVKDIHPSGDSNPKNIVIMDGKLYFVANDDRSQQGLWVSDGTTQGTNRLGNFTGVENLVVMTGDNSLYFTTKNGSALWKYDGTTIPDTPVIPELTFSNAAQLTIVESSLYFVAHNGYGTELWISNSSGTQMVIDLASGSGNGMSSSSKLYGVGGTLFFTDAFNKLYKTNGTEATTIALTDSDSYDLIVYYYAVNTGAGGDFVYFIRNTDRAVWRTDGTPAGTIKLTDNQVGYSLRDLQVASNGDVYFMIGSTLWRSDGTPGGTARVQNYISRHKITKDGNAVYTYSFNRRLGYIDVSEPYLVTEYHTFANYETLNLYAGQKDVYFSYDDRIHYREPWVSDGTSTGTVLLGDINSFPNSGSYPYDKAILNGTLFFIASDGDDYGLWRSDGTDAGTVQIKKDFYDVSSLTVSGDKLYFVAEDDEHGEELWVTDGTEAGTHIVIDLYPGEYGSYPESLVDVNGTLFFIDDENWLIWKTDGTQEGTLPVSGIISPYSDLVAAGDKVYFVYDDDSHGEELWVTDGSFHGTRMVKDIYPGDSSGVNDYYFRSVAVGNYLYFSADDGSNGRELWKTDGTPEGTKMIININADDDGLHWQYQNMYVANDAVYFIAHNDNGDLELWKTNGTVEGTVQLTFLEETGGQVNYGTTFEFFNNELYFSASNSTDGIELWKTDGTPEGTAMLKNIHPSGNSSPSGFNVFNNSLFFTANDGVHGNELWKTDGTEDGTVMVKDVAEGLESGTQELKEGSSH